MAGRLLNESALQSWSVLRATVLICRRWFAAGASQCYVLRGFAASHIAAPPHSRFALKRRRHDAVAVECPSGTWVLTERPNRRAARVLPPRRHFCFSPAAGDGRLHLLSSFHQGRKGGRRVMREAHRFPPFLRRQSSQRDAGLLRLSHRLSTFFICAQVTSESCIFRIVIDIPIHRS